jgi:hypothetical protein
MTPDLFEWRRRVIPSCMSQARGAVEKLRERGVQAELVDGVFELGLALEPNQDGDARAAEVLDSAWPAWSECLTAPD